MNDKLRTIIAWTIGFFLYMIAALLTVDLSGASACLCQPIMGFLFGGVLVGLAHLLRMFVRFLRLDRCKTQMRILNIFLLFAGLLLALFSQSIGLNYSIFDSMANEYFLGPNPIAVLVGCLLLNFSIINW
jgi:hypothetical protein